MNLKKLLISSVASAVLASGLLGAKVTVLKTTLAEEAFQTGILTEVLKKMGHEVEYTNGVSYDIAYQTIANNANSDDVYMMAASWDPLHNTKIEGAGGEKKLAKFGEYISNCAQGYLIDKKTAQKYNIKYYNDLKDPKIAKVFDIDGNGKADLTGCIPGWGCYDVIEHQLKAFGMDKTVQHNKGEYSALIADTIANYNSGKPILYYTWTPYWVSGKLVPGRDVVFLQVTHSAHPSGKSTKLGNGADYGFNVNSQKIVTNASVRKKHKDIEKLLEVMNISVNDISGQNMLMSNGHNKDSDIKRHVQSWLKANAAKVNSWITEAKAAK